MSQTGRIFWLGAHMVLKPTELKRLRQLGYEVFNPAYISPVYDQSMDRRIDDDQPTTLPRDVFETLLAHDFFYTQTPDNIAELLNEYFSTIIVTINPDWLLSILKAYRGRVIWRIYGQHYILSDHIASRDGWEALVSRDNFHIVPFAAESIEREHRWFVDRCTEIVPYQIADDVFEYSGCWESHAHRPEIAVSIPNIENLYYSHVYHGFASQHPHRVFRIYGRQRAVPPDRRIVGDLARNDFLTRFACSAGYYYVYDDDVCYLPPIEMMEIGGPVLYAPRSLLSRFYKDRTPGLVVDKFDAEVKIRLLLADDKVFIKEVIAAQEPVRARYDRNVVTPIFDAAFTRLLDADRIRSTAVKVDGAVVVAAHSRPKSGPTIYVFLHVDGLFQHVRGEVYAFEGIPRVVDVIVEALTQFADYKIIVTCTEISAPILYDFFRSNVDSGRVLLRRVACSGRDGARGNLDKLWLVEEINNDREAVAVVVPHYYLFPEALALLRPIVMYLPDYFPHIMPKVVFDVSVEKDQENKQVGVAIAKRAVGILTNSHYTKSYLPAAGFVDAASIDKVVVAPLPLLGGKRAQQLSSDTERELTNELGASRYIFYPTANRPNKQFAFLMRLFAAVRVAHPDLRLVLTGSLDTVPGVREVADHFSLHDHIVYKHRVDESSLRWLYEHASLLCLTSTLEGNFPPQVIEALSYGTAVVATRLITITDLVGEHAEDLLLCDPLDLEDFREKIELALSEPERVRRRQQRAVDFLATNNTMERFYDGLAPLFERCVRAAAEEGAPTCG